MKVLVCGGRDYQDQAKAFATLDAIWKSVPLDTMTVICGAANGADRLATNWAMHREVPFDWFPAEWKKFGKAAGPMRNQKMLEKGQPDLVVAFPGGRGTDDMVRRAEAAGVPIQRVT